MVADDSCINVCPFKLGIQQDRSSLVTTRVLPFEQNDHHMQFRSARYMYA